MIDSSLVVIVRREPSGRPQIRNGPVLALRPAVDL